MSDRVVDIEGNDRYLAVERGFMVVRESGPGAVELGRVPVDDLAAVIVSGHGLTFSANLVAALAERGAILVFSDAKHRPTALLTPVAGHHLQAARAIAQAQATPRLKARLWRDVIRTKLDLQAQALAIAGKPNAAVKRLIARVRTGDPDNVEAQGARRMWTLLLGSEFRRDRQADGVNALLNYGYMVLRAAVARAIVAAGLNPALGIHHRNAQNPMCLADDLMEPFRPCIDLVVWRLIAQGKTTVDRHTKADLVRVLRVDLGTTRGATPVAACVQRLAMSLASVYLHESTRLELPEALQVEPSGELNE